MMPGQYIIRFQVAFASIIILALLILITAGFFTSGFFTTGQSHFSFNEFGQIYPIGSIPHALFLSMLIFVGIDMGLIQSKMTYFPDN